MLCQNFSRRNFLKKFTITTTTAFAVPYVITSKALGQGNIPPASERITVGHIGVGNRGGSLLRNFLELDPVQSIAVADPFQNRREERASTVNQFYADKYGKGTYKACAAHTDFRELLDRPDIDAVVIATPDHWHVPIASYAARAGKDLYVEKPLGVSIRENIRLRELIQKNGNIFQYGTQQRSERNFRYVCELVHNHRIGALQRIDVWCPGIYAQDQFHEPGGSVTPIPVPAGFDYDLWLGPAPFSPYTSDRCTEWGTYYHYDNSLGFIAGWGAHPLDIAQWGNHSDHTAPISYQGQGTFIRDGLYTVIDSWDMHLEYASGVIMHFMSDGVAQPIVAKYHPNMNSHGTTFFGSDGWVSVDRGGIYANPPHLLNSVIGPNEIHLYESDHHYKNFINCVKKRSQPISTIESAVQSDFISHLCDISIRTEQAIRWDPQNETILSENVSALRMQQRPLRGEWRL